MEFLAILASMPFESEAIFKQLKNVFKIRIAGKFIYKGKLSDTNVILMNTGIGKVNAAHSATALLENLRIRYVVNIGVGGAYPEAGLNIGDIAIAAKEIYGDEGVITSKGWRDTKEIGIPFVRAGKKKYFNEFPMDMELTKKTVRSLIAPHPEPHGSGHQASRITQIKSGNFVTVSTTTGTHKKASELERRFNAICENMEGAAIAHVCTIYGIHMLEVRGISNIAGIRDKRKWDLKLASGNCQKAVLKIIKTI